VQKNIEEMEQELNHPDHWTKAAVTQGLYNILLISLRTGKPKDPCQEEIADKIQQAAKYISEHYADWLTLEDAARIAQMEKTYFCKRFKALTGFGFLEYLTQTRLQAAQELLTTTELSIGDISEACGFSSSNYFGDVFRRCLGMSPTDFRLRVKEDDSL
jgi:AraC-like DNA-binding protein